MRTSDFIESIDEKTPENIITKIAVEDTAKQQKRLKFNFIANKILEGAKLESARIADKSLWIIFSKDGEIFSLDWQDGYGAMLSEFIPPEPLED